MKNTFTIPLVRMLLVSAFVVVSINVMHAQTPTKQSVQDLHVIGYPYVVEPVTKDMKAEPEVQAPVNQGKGLLAEIAEMEAELNNSKDNSRIAKLSQEITSKKKIFIADKSSVNFFSIPEEERDVYMKYVKELDAPLYQKIMKDYYNE